MKVIINEKQHKILLENTINEELGMANSVNNVSKEIIRIINQSIINNQNSYFNLTDFDFIGNLFIYYTHHQVNNESEINSLIEAGLLTSSLLDENGKIINGKISNVKLYLNFVSLNGKIVTNFFQSIIYHEINHLYQSYRKLLNNRSISINDIYHLFSNNTNHKNEYIAKISKALYFSYEFEQDAFSNELYGFIKNNPQYNPKDLLYKSNANQYLLMLKSLLNEIPLWSDNEKLIELNNILNNNTTNINLFKRKIIKIIENTIKRFETKFHKIYVKVLNDLNEKQYKKTPILLNKQFLI